MDAPHEKKRKDAEAARRIRDLERRGLVDWASLSYNDALPRCVILDLLGERPWDYDALSLHPALPWRAVWARPDLPWNWDHLTVNPSVAKMVAEEGEGEGEGTRTTTMWDEEAAELSDGSPPRWNLDLLGKNPGLTWTDAILHVPVERWCWRDLSCHPNFVSEILRAPFLPWVWSEVSTNAGLDPMRDVLHRPDLPWDYGRLSAHPRLTWIVVECLPQKDWDFAALSGHPCVTWKAVTRDMPNAPWSLAGLSRNPNLPPGVLSFLVTADSAGDGWCWKALCEHANPRVARKAVRAVLRRPDLLAPSSSRHVWAQFSRNPHLRWDRDVWLHQEVPWDWSGLSANSAAVDMRIVEAHPDLPWDWTWLSTNKSVTYRDVVSRPHASWNWSLLSMNPSVGLDAALGSVSSVRDKLDAGLLCFFSATLRDPTTGR